MRHGVLRVGGKYKKNINFKLNDGQILLVLLDTIPSFKNSVEELVDNYKIKKHPEGCLVQVIFAKD